MIIDPVSKQRVVFDKYSGDVQYDVIGGSAISTQVVSRIGISGLTRGDQYNRGQSNALAGTIPGLEGERLPDLGVTGENKQTTERVQITRRVEV